VITPDDGRPVVAAFDFDGTLIPGDCLLMLHRQLKGVAGLALDWLHLIAPFQAWVGGSLSTAAFKERYLGVLLRGTTREARSAALGQKLPAAQWRALRPRALARLRWHQAQGHRVVIISASPRALIAPLAARLGVDLLATETSDPLAHGPATPLRLSSANCKGEEKVRRLGAWLDRPLEEISLHAYGDSRGDRQLLEVSTAPHWRSFGPDPLPYPARKPKAAPPGGWIPLLALLLLSLALFGLTGLDPVERLSLQGGLGRVMAWLPAIYGILGVAYLGRYWRWRLLLSSAGIGRWGWRDARAWFVGFALTATPGKLGELSRVQQLHRELDYPRPLLVHVFVAERLCDGAAVLLWLALLAPSALRAGLGRLPPTGIGLLLLAGAATLLAAIWIWSKVGRTLAAPSAQWCPGQGLPAGRRRDSGDLGLRITDSLAAGSGGQPRPHGADPGGDRHLPALRIARDALHPPRRRGRERGGHDPAAGPLRRAPVRRTRHRHPAPPLHRVECDRAGRAARLVARQP